MTSRGPDRYTQVPRATLWLLEGGVVTIGDGVGDRDPSFTADVPSFYVGKGPITNEEYEAFDPAHERCAASSADRDPVVHVSWHDAVAYCEWYAQLARKPFRLPTEIEWEFACRGGVPGWTPWGEDATAADRFAWHAGNAEGRCHEVESLRANAAGIHDTLGNVWEWTASPYAPYPPHAPEAPVDGAGSGERVLRGGSFRSTAAELSAAVRKRAREGFRADDVGFRIVRSL